MSAESKPSANTDFLDNVKDNGEDPKAIDELTSRNKTDDSANDATPDNAPTT